MASNADENYNLINYFWVFLAVYNLLFVIVTRYITDERSSKKIRKAQKLYPETIKSS